MQEYLSIGPTPAEEECTQVGDPDYEMKARAECQRFIDRIRMKLGPEPKGAKLFVKWNEHDLGRYAEVAVKFDVDDEAATEYALKVESEAPDRWEDA